MPQAAFRTHVLAVVRRIPPGRVATYGDVAAAAGHPGAARAVGNIMRDCGVPGVPCHRVIAAGGRLGGYGGHEELKRSLLRAEGVRVTRTRIRDFEQCRWPPPPRAAPSARPRRSGSAELPTANPRNKP